MTLHGSPVSLLVAIVSIAFLAMAMSSLARRALEIAIRTPPGALPKIHALGRFCSVLLLVLPRIATHGPPPHLEKVAAQVVTENDAGAFASLEDGSDAIGTDGTKEESSRKDENEPPSLELQLGILVAALRWPSQSFRTISTSRTPSYPALPPNVELDDPRERAPPTVRS